MRRFRFGLARVQRLRQHQERAARLAMAEELSALHALEESQRQVDASLAVCAESGQDGHLIQLARALEGGLMAARRRLDRDIQAAEGRLERARGQYQERRRDLLALERLRERRHAAWRQAAAAEEQREFDESARMRFVARSREASR